MATAKKTAAKKSPAKKSASSTKSASKSATAKKAAPSSMPKAGRNPEGGLTAAGRKFFAERDGSHLRPGVTGPADTPDKQKRKGSFLARTFTHPRGPMRDDKGEPTRLALSAHAWGEPVPNTEPEAKKLAAKGQELLAKARTARGEGDKKPARTAKRPSKAAKSAS